MTPLRSLLVSLSVALAASVAMLAPTMGVGPGGPLVAGIRDDAAAARGARLLVLGNSVADSTLHDPTFSTAALGSPAAARVVTVPGGGPQVLDALLRNALRGARPAVVLVWLLPATWRDTTAPASQDLARLLALAGPGDTTLAARLFQGSRSRLLWAQWSAGRGQLRDALVQGLTQTAAMPVLGRSRPSAVFAEVVGDWAPVESPPPIEDPTWPQTQLAPLVESTRARGAELWLMEPTDPSGAPASRFTPAEQAAIRSLGASLVNTLPSALPREAMGAAGHITPAWKERASEEAGAWLRANPPTSALSKGASPRPPG